MYQIQDRQYLGYKRVYQTVWCKGTKFYIGNKPASHQTHE
uniref:Uncharacterized protein n=1 Tax=Nitrosopumivirus cobalaminus TaxID=3158414 RepID=A0AAU7N470_9VIRU